VRHRTAPRLRALTRAILVVGLAALAAPAAEPRPSEAKRAVGPVAPELPYLVAERMQAGKYAEAIDFLNHPEPTAKPENRAYYDLIKGIAQRLSSKPDDARKTLQAAIDAAPAGPWAAKLRAELAAVELAAHHYAEAEALARQEAERLLAGDRKDRLAAVYFGFAQRLLKPDTPVAPPDPEGAYALLARARTLAQGSDLRASLLLAMARASQQAGNHGRAIGDFQAYLSEYPRGSGRIAARFGLGEAQLAAGQPIPARLTWSDLARDLDGKDGTDVRGRALHGVARTFGIPNPPDDSALSLGVAALRRLLAADPNHALAPKAASEIGASYLARGKSQEALSALNDFLKGEGYTKAETEDARRELAPLLMTAQFQVGQVLQGQAKFAEAIEAFRAYQARYPDGPQSADAQRAVLDTQVAAANDLLGHRQYADARASWRAFVGRNPLDPRVPQLLYQVGESFQAEEKFADAIAAYETLAGKFPGSEPAAHAQFQVAALDENEKGDPAAAIERFKKITVEPWQAQARQRIAVMEAKALTVVTPRAFRSGESPHLKIGTRNIETLTFTAYNLDPEAYFRKKHALGGVESLDVGLVAADAEWTAEVKGYGKYKPVEADYQLKEIKVPGVWVVKVTDEKSLQATTLVLGSDVDAIVKTSRDQLLVFAQDMKTGKGRAGARVLVADESGIILEAETGKDGVLLKDWPKPRDPNGHVDTLILDGADAAGTGLGIPGQVAQGLSARAYLYTDRPAYRPGQEVQLRGVVREVKEGRYDHEPGAKYRLEVTDSRGRQFVARPVTLSGFGTFHEAIPVDPGAPVGTYRVRLHRPGGSEFAGQFEVQAYQLRKVDLTFDLPKTVYFRGETIKADVVARYQYGTPLANRPIRVGLPDGRVLDSKTDAAGKYHVELPTDGFAEEQALRLVAQLPQDGVAAIANVMLAVRAFRIDLETGRDVYLAGESFDLRAATVDALGEPTGQELRVSVLKRIDQAGRIVEREVAKETIATDPKTGRGSASLIVKDEEGGSFVVRVAGTDRFKNPVVAERALTISGKEDETKLRILADRQSFKVGEDAKVNLHSRAAAGTALLAWEADRILSYKIVPTREGDNPLTWEVDGGQFPNVSLTAARMDGTHFHQARLDLRVERDLRVTVAPAKPTVGPGGAVEVEVTTLDQLGRPVAAEVSLALVDKALLRLHGDPLPPIGRFFYDQSRTGAFATEATNTFRYEPQTTPVAEAIVEEADRQKAEERDRVPIDVADMAGKFRAADPTLPALKPDGSNRAELLAILRAKREAGMAKNEVEAPAPSAPAPAPEGVPPLSAPETSASLTHAGREKGRPDVASRSFADLDVDADEAPTGNLMVGVSASSHQGLNGNRIVQDSDKSSKLGALLVNPDGSVLMEDQTKAPAMAFRSAVPNQRQKFYQLQHAPLRQRFVETAYWNPSVVTGKDGKAKLTFPAPTALSEYRLTARGVTGAETLAGQATADLAVRKDFFVDLKTPATLTEGDKPRFLAEVHHVGIVGKLEVRLTAYAGSRERVMPKTVELKGDGVEEVAFEPFDVPDSESVRLVLAAKVGDAADEVEAEVPVRPWGVQATASASGTASNDATVSVGLPAGRDYEAPELLVVVAPTVRRMLVELALGRDAYALDRPFSACLIAPFRTVSDDAGDLLAAASVLECLRSPARAMAPPPGAGEEVIRLTDRARGLVSALTTLQNDDGGWPWVAGTGAEKRPSDRLTSARVAFALASAAALGLAADPKGLDKADAYLAQEFARADAADLEARATLLHALSLRHKATFEQANALNRRRQDLPDVALAYLALTFANLDRAELAVEVLQVLGPRAKSESAGPGTPDRRYWEGGPWQPWHGSAVETTALVTLAIARAQPGSRLLGGAVEWLQAHRRGLGWQPAKAHGPAVAALAANYGHYELGQDRYRLTVTVNEVEVARIEVAGVAEGKAIRVPRRAIKAGAENRVQFAIEGKGTYGYALTLTGFARDFKPDQDPHNRPFRISRRAYVASAPELEGKVLPAGFGVAVEPVIFGNPVSQVPLGGRASVHIEATRVDRPGLPAWEREALVLQDYLPAGATLVEGSVRSQAAHHELVDGVLTFYFAPDQSPGDIRYDVFGALPGEYRALPPRLSDAYDPGRSHLGPEGTLTVLPAGAKSTDPYRATPDELHARGKYFFDAGRLAEAAAPLEELSGRYTLRPDVLKDTARMLLAVHIAGYDPRKIVRDFEVLKEKAPELVVPFDQIRVVGRAYRDIGEPERAYLVWRAIAEASYLEDAQVGEALRQKGKDLEGIAFLLDLWREYPATAAIEADVFGLAQLLADLANRAVADPRVRRELADAGVTRPDLLLQAIRLTRSFLARSPGGPQADEASLALVGDFLELEDFEGVVKLARRFAELYPGSPFLDSFQYSEALGRFHLGEYDRAIAVARTIADASYKDANGVDQPSPNKWQALYILGQIHDARRQPGKALDYYRQVADRFTDAAGAVKALEREELKLPEVSIVRPARAVPVAADGRGGVGLRALAADAPKDEAKAATLTIESRNLAEAAVTVYPVDLMRLYLARRNLSEIAGIDLAGIKPLLEQKVKLGGSSDFDDRSQALELPLTKDGAYLVMARGHDRYASGIVLVTPLELDVLEEPEAGRVRVTVRDARTKDPVPKVQVKVIGSDNAAFRSGQTDLRGVFVAEGVVGTVTTVARKGTKQYAFHRGTRFIGSRPSQPAEDAKKAAPAAPNDALPAPRAPDMSRPSQALDANIQQLNRSNQERQIERLQGRYNDAGKGVQVDKAR